MPVLKDKELRIVGFLCNWCSYGGADTAGVARATQPTDLRIIRVPCTGRVDPLFVLKALFGGADGVLVSGCHPRDCHYSVGNYYARRRLEVIKRFLPIWALTTDALNIPGSLLRKANAGRKSLPTLLPVFTNLAKHQGLRMPRPC